MIPSPSNNRRGSVLIAGSFPPPYIGPTVAMKQLISNQELHRRMIVHFLDMSDHRAGSNIGKFEFGNLVYGIWHAIKGLATMLTRWPDAVYLGVSQGTWGYLRDLAILMPARLLGRRLVIHLRGSEFRVFYGEMPGWLKALTRWIFKHPTRVIVLGHRLRAIFSGLVSDENIVVIPNGINCDVFTPVSQEQKPSSDSPVRILFLGSLKRRKGIFVLLRALAILAPKIPQIRITVAGPWRTPAEQAEAEAIIREHNLAAHLNFVGQVDNDQKKALLHSHDLLVFTPVEPEGLPWVILESMSSGLAVISSDQGAIAEVVVPGETGKIVQPTPEAVADALHWAWTNPAEVRRCGTAGRKRVESEFSEPVYFRRLIDTLSTSTG